MFRIFFDAVAASSLFFRGKRCCCSEFSQQKSYLSSMISYQAMTNLTTHEIWCDNRFASALKHCTRDCFRFIHSSRFELASTFKIFLLRRQTTENINCTSSSSLHMTFEWKHRRNHQERNSSSDISSIYLRCLIRIDCKQQITQNGSISREA